MNMLVKRPLFVLIMVYGCFSLGQSGTGIQNSNTLQTPPQPIQLKNLPSPQKITPQAPTPLPKLEAQPEISQTKYAEYQSYCRSNDYDLPVVLREFESSSIDVLNIYKMIEKKRFKEAFVQMSESRPIIGDSEYFKLLIWLKLNEKNFKEANKIADSIPLAMKNQKKLQMIVAQISEKQENYTESRILIQDIFEKNSTDVELLSDICRLFVLDSQHRDAEIACVQAQKKNPRQFLNSIWLGISFRERLMYNEANEEFKKSIEIRPSEFAFTCLAEVAFLQKRETQSIKYFEQAVSLFPTSNRAQLGLAKLYFENRDYRKALDHFKKSCQLEPKNKLEFRKAQKQLQDQKNSQSEIYFQEVTKCSLAEKGN